MFQFTSLFYSFMYVFDIVRQQFNQIYTKLLKKTTTKIIVGFCSLNKK